MASHALVLAEESGHSDINNINNVCRNKCRRNRKSGLHFCLSLCLVRRKIEDTVLFSQGCMESTNDEINQLHISTTVYWKTVETFSLFTSPWGRKGWIKNTWILTSRFSPNLLCNLEQVSDHFVSLICSHLQNEDMKTFLVLHMELFLHSTSHY